MEKFDLYIVAGDIGTGKTTAGNKLAEPLGAEIHDLDSVRREIGITDYDPKDRDRINAEITLRVRNTLSKGKPAVVCATFDKRVVRDRSYELLGELNVLVIQCECSEKTAKARITKRPPKDRLHMPSNDPTVYENRKATSEPLQQDEIDKNPRISFITYDTETNTIASIVVRDTHQKAVEVVRGVLLGN